MSPHTTVLLQETVDALSLREGDIAIDCTVGAGGHTEKMLEKVGKTGRVIGIDRDATALALAEKRLADAVRDGRLTLVNAAFDDIAAVAAKAGVTGRVQGIAADIGVSSMHLDQAARGFSFMADGPLDMRMDQSRGQTAAELLATASEDDLVRIFRDYGEEPKAKFIARAIVKQRETAPLATTAELASLVEKNVHYKEKSKKHPATRVFQALRIAVNDELGQLERLLADSLPVLRTGGRLAIIAFHSLEDRVVKHAFIEYAATRLDQKVPRHLPVRPEDMPSRRLAKGTIVKPFPLTPEEAEVRLNPRARSAKLRVFETGGPSS